MTATGAMLVCLAAGLVLIVQAQIPIPRREVGFVYAKGDANAPVHLDFYIDLICPDSKEAIPTVLKVARMYGPHRLQLTTHLFPLPYHRNSFYASKGAHVIKQLAGEDKVYDWFNILYADIENLTNTATYHKSDAEIVEMLAKLANQTVPGISSKFEQLLDTVEMDTRVAWKYSCTRGVAATPTFMLNDVVIDAEPTWTVDDWKNVIDPLLTPEWSLRFRQAIAGCPRDTKRCEYLPGKVECCTKGENCIPNVGCRC